MPRPRFPWDGVLFYAPLAIAGGAVIGFFINRFQFDIRSLIQGGLIGFACFFASIWADWIFHDWIARGGAWRRALVYFTASQLAWPLALFGGLIFLWGIDPGTIRLPRVLVMIIIALGAAGTALGVGISTYELMKRRLQESLEQLKEKEIAEKELELARAFQARLLPAPEIAADGYRIVGRNLAARYVAGDFYDVFRYADGTIGVAIADVAGKGVAASLIMASVKAVLPLLAGTGDVDQAMIALNAKLSGELSKREFVAMALARYDPRNGTLTVANAGIPDPYIVRSGGGIEPLSVRGPRLPLGLRREVTYEKERAQLDRGDALLLFSDGLPEANGPDGEPIGYERLLSIIAESRDADAILAGVSAASPGPRDDDQTLVVIERIAEGATS